MADDMTAEVNAAIRTDSGRTEVPYDVGHLEGGSTPAEVAAAAHRVAHGAECTDPAALYLLAEAVSSDIGAFADEAEAVRFVDLKLANPFPPSLPSLGGDGTISEAMFDAAARWPWAVAVGAARTDSQTAAALAAIPLDGDVPVGEVTDAAADELLAAVSAWVAKVVAAARPAT